MLFTDREVEGGGHNRVIGPDFQWRPTDKDQLTGQFLVTDTQTPNLPDITPEWNGDRFSSRAIFLSWLHTGPHWTFRSTYQDLGDGFRADDGFVPQVGFREVRQFVGYTFFSQTGFFGRLQPLFLVDYFSSPSGDLITRKTSPGLFFLGRLNLNGEIDLNWREKDRIGSKVLETTSVAYFVQFDPDRRLSRITLQGYLGEGTDVANVRVGHGGDVNLAATIKPTDHLQLEFNGDRQWLDVDSGGRSGRLFTAQIERLKATYNFSAKMFVRVIGQYLQVDADPSLYTDDVPKRSGGFDGSALFSYKLNWQTVLFLGYGDSRVLDDHTNLLRANRQFFLKVSYAFQT